MTGTACAFLSYCGITDQMYSICTVCMERILPWSCCARAARVARAGRPGATIFHSTRGQTPCTPPTTTTTTGDPEIFVYSTFVHGTGSPPSPTPRPTSACARCRDERTRVTQPWLSLPSRAGLSVFVVGLVVQLETEVHTLAKHAGVVGGGDVEQLETIGNPFGHPRRFGHLKH